MRRLPGRRRSSVMRWPTCSWVTIHHLERRGWRRWPHLRPRRWTLRWRSGSWLDTVMHPSRKPTPRALAPDWPLSWLAGNVLPGRHGIASTTGCDDPERGAAAALVRDRLPGLGDGALTGRAMAHQFYCGDGERACGRHGPLLPFAARRCSRPDERRRALDPCGVCWRRGVGEHLPRDPAARPAPPLGGVGPSPDRICRSCVDDRHLGRRSDPSGRVPRPGSAHDLSRGCTLRLGVLRVHDRRPDQHHPLLRGPDLDRAPCRSCPRAESDAHRRSLHLRAASDDSLPDQRRGAAARPSMGRATRCPRQRHPPLAADPAGARRPRPANRALVCGSADTEEALGDIEPSVAYPHATTPRGAPAGEPAPGCGSARGCASANNGPSPRSMTPCDASSSTSLRAPDPKHWAGRFDVLLPCERVGSPAARCSRRLTDKGRTWSNSSPWLAPTPAPVPLTNKPLWFNLDISALNSG